MTATGEIGVVKVGFQQAASIRRWTLTHSNKVLGSASTTIVARVVGCNTYLTTFRPTSVWLDMGTVWWRWNKVVSITPILPGTTVEIEVEGTPEIEKHNKE